MMYGESRAQRSDELVKQHAPLVKRIAYHLLARLPSSLAEAADLLDRSLLARTAFGDAVVDFYVHHARLECAAFNGSVTDWEKARYFEQI